MKNKKEFMRRTVKYWLLFFLSCFFSIAVADNCLNSRKENKRTRFRVSTSFGPQIINSQVMKNDSWNSVLNFVLGASLPCKIHDCQYGIDIGTSSAWDARFNSVNNSDSIAVAPLHIHNSASLNFIAFLSWNFNQFGVEVGFGPKISWVKWLNSVQQAKSGVRIVPILLFKITKPLSNHIELFVAATQTMNFYKKLKCNDAKFNCFNDAGYVSWSSLLLGLTYYI